MELGAIRFTSRPHTTYSEIFFVSNFRVNDALTPSKLDQSVALLIFMREIPGSNLGPTVLTADFRVFPRFQPEIPR